MTDTTLSAYPWFHLKTSGTHLAITIYISRKNVLYIIRSPLKKCIQKLNWSLLIWIAVLHTPVLAAVWANNVTEQGRYFHSHWKGGKTSCGMSYLALTLPAFYWDIFSPEEGLLCCSHLPSARQYTAEYFGISDCFSLQLYPLIWTITLA